MGDVKTKPTTAAVESFINSLPDEQARLDSKKLAEVMEQITGEPAIMWGTAIIGFGTYHYQYDSGREGEICLTGFSPRKGKLSLYVLSGFPGQDEFLLQLGKYKAGKSCLYVKSLDDISLDVLKKVIAKSCSFLKAKNQA